MLTEKYLYMQYDICPLEKWTSFYCELIELIFIKTNLMKL